MPIVHGNGMDRSGHYGEIGRGARTTPTFLSDAKYLAESKRVFDAVIIGKSSASGNVSRASHRTPLPYRHEDHSATTCIPNAGYAQLGGTK